MVLFLGLLNISFGGMIMEKQEIICPECQHKNIESESFVYNYRGNSVYRCQVCGFIFAEFEAGVNE